MSTHQQQHHAAAVVRGSRMLAANVNEGIKTHPSAGTYRSEVDKMHAEAAVLSCLPNIPPRATMIVVRAGGSYSRPCKECMDRIRRAGIRTIIYSECPEWFTVERVTNAKR
jgi:deoxycytidylate deaminase